MTQKESTIKAVGFDLFGTLAAFSINDQFYYMADYLDVQVDDLAAAVLSKLKYAPNGPSGDIWPHIGQELDVEIPELLTEGWQNDFFQILIRPELVALIQRLRRNGYKVGLLSNIEVGTVLPLAFESIFSLFDKAYRSDEMRHTKPQPEAFETFINGLGAKADECIFIDDLPGNIHGSQEAGLIGVQYQDSKQVMEELQKLGVRVY